MCDVMYNVVCVFCRAESGMCTNVAIGQTASIDVTVTMTECLDGPTTA